VVTTGAGAVFFGSVKTPSSNRVIPLPKIVADELAAPLARFGEGSDRLVFVASTGSMICRQTSHKVFRRLFQKMCTECARRLLQRTFDTSVCPGQRPGGSSRLTFWKKK
jgi:hypothetical protein